MPSAILWTHDSRYAPEALSASKARAFVSRRLREHHLSYLVPDVQVVVSDLVTNALLDSVEPVDITLEALMFGVQLTVRTEPTSSDHTDGASGRRLCLVKLLSADHGACATGSDEGEGCIWATFPVSPVLMTAQTDAYGHHPADDPSA